MNIALDLEGYKHIQKMRTQADLAKELDVSVNYIQRMKSYGFRMPGGKANLIMANNFLEECEAFKVTEKK